MRRPWIKDKTVAIVVGGAIFVIGALVLYDAFERRGGRPPFFVRPFLPW